MRTAIARLVGMLRGTRLDRELDDEVAFHLEMLVDENVRRGMNRDDARAAALRTFGGITQMKEHYREQRSLPSMETLLQDARYGTRALARTPGFTLTALLTLALGIGANTAILSVVNAVLLRPLPYPEPDRILRMFNRYPGGEYTGSTGLFFMYYRDHLRAFDALGAWRGTTGVNLVAGDTAEYVRALPVSKEYFAVFGVAPVYGQPFSADEDRVGGPDVAILGHGIWQRLFGGGPHAIGSSVVLGDRPHRVVGVMPASFSTVPAADLFIPLRTGTSGPGGGTNYNVAGRLEPGLTREQANAEAAAVFDGFKQEVLSKSAWQTGQISPIFRTLQDSLSSSVKPALLMILAAVGLLLLIACANTANLLLARASGRGREIAVRAALGAGRGRIVRQLLTESVLLAVGGALIGLALAYWSVPALLALTPPGFTVEQEVHIDATVLAVTLAIAVITGLLFGLAPAVTVTRHSLVDAFKEDGTRTTSNRRAAWLRKGLVVGEVALSMLLLVSAGLLLQTFLKMRAIDTGFDPAGVLTARMALQGDRYSFPGEVNRFYDEALDRIRQIPGVKAAAVVNGVPIERGLNLNVDVLDGPVKVEHALTDWRYATADYFKAMGIEIVAGRGFDDGDRAGAPPVAVVSQQFARQFFKDTDPIGRHIRVFPRQDSWMEIVGIAKNVREQGLTGPLPAVMYVPVAQTHRVALATTHGYFQVSWVVRVEKTGPELERAIREAVRQVDPKQPFSRFRTMEEVKGAAIAEEQFQMTLLAVFAAIGLVLASAGIYGLIAYSVAQRTREFGIRIALGAGRQRILRSVLLQGATLAASGVVVGAVAGLALARVLQNFVWGVSSADPLTFGAVAAILISVAVLASFVPALRAVRLNPVRALRE